MDHELGLGRAAVVEHERELVAPEAEGMVAEPERALQDRADGGQRRVPGRVAVSGR
jgi:hypothetical protein